MMILVLSLLSAILYRAGGLSKEEKHWIPVWMRFSAIRDWGCMACALIPIAIHHPSWWILAAYGLSVAALSTYWDWLWGEDNFWFSGLMVGAALIPLLWSGAVPHAILLRAIFIGMFWGFICDWSDDVNVEEYSRGFLVSIPTLMLQ